MNIPELIKMMNQRGAERLPFLFVVDFELSEGIFLERPLTSQEILFRLPGIANYRAPEAPNSASIVTLKAFPVPYDEYKAGFDVVMAGLRRGDSFLVNYTARTPVATALSLKEIFLASRSPYGIYVPGRFVCFSPERFVRIADGIISTNPMKGTASANLPGAQEALLADPKERAEHYTIVDLMRNDIGTVADSVEVKRFRYIDKIRTGSGTILQTSSEITGRLPADHTSHLGDIILRMLPAGSVSGAPKMSTVDIIKMAERGPRGFYTGVFGYFDGRTLDSAVMIRYIEEYQGQKFFRSGGGITVNSIAENEYSEVCQKIYLPI